MHSGWGALIAISCEAPAFQVAHRARIVVCGSPGPRANQPYHHAAELGLAAAEIFLDEYTANAEQLAVKEISAAIELLRGRNFRVSAAAILLASGRMLPALPQILAAHPLIHTAEGELFRNVARNACERLGLRVEGLRERDLDQRATAIWGQAAAGMKERIASLGKAIGPPWTQDQKTAALAAAMALAGASHDLCSGQTAS